MTSRARELLREALTLPIAERADVAAELLAGHHALDVRAVLGAVNALRKRFDRAIGTPTRQPHWGPRLEPALGH